MLWLKKQYNNYKSGIIFTLIFHIVVFIILNISQFKIKEEYHEAEILIDFPEELIQQPEPDHEESNSQDNNSSFNRKTNVASNKAQDSQNEFFDENYQKELEEAQKLVNDVSEQLSKEIPTIDDLHMPEETTENINPDSILNKLYSGDSNVEYFLENRYHLRLPIPVYLSQYGGTVRVNIIVDRAGNVTKADPEIKDNSNELLLSYAKTAALRTKFNYMNSGASRQNGYITYRFVAQ